METIRHSSSLVLVGRDALQELHHCPGRRARLTRQLALPVHSFVSCRFYHCRIFQVQEAVPDLRWPQTTTTSNH